MTASPVPERPPVFDPQVERRDDITYGAVHLDVADIERSLPFWRDAVGLQVLASPDGTTNLGVPGRTLIVLHPGARFPAGRGTAGLYHVAIHVADAVEFARVLARLQLAGVPQSPTDHVFSKATYLRDPDGIMLELTLETPERFGSIELSPTSVVVRDNEGRRRNPTEALDLESALRPLADHDPRGPLAAGSFVGHVHLHVPQLPDAFAFYREVLGFSEHAYMESIGMADLSAGGVFPHRLALNNWQGPTARQPQPGTAGLRHFELVLREQSAFDALRTRVGDPPLDSETASVLLDDPAGNTIAVRARGATP